MDQNRYAPPKSAVEDVPADPGRPPPQVMYAIALWAASCCLGLVVLVWSWETYSRLQRPEVLMTNEAVALALTAVLLYYIYRGRNWARITWLLLTLLGVLVTLSSGATLAQLPTGANMNTMVEFVMFAVIVWLLFFSPGREWFRQRPFR